MWKVRRKCCALIWSYLQVKWRGISNWNKHCKCTFLEFFFSGQQFSSTSTNDQNYLSLNLHFSHKGSFRWNNFTHPQLWAWELRLSPSPLPLCELTQLDICTKPLTAEDTSPDQAFHIVFGQLCPFNILARFSPNVESHTESSRCRSCSSWLSLCGSLSFPKGQKARRQSLVKVREPTPSHGPTRRQPVPTPQQLAHGSRDKNVTPKHSAWGAHLTCMAAENQPFGLCSLVKFLFLMGDTEATSLHQPPGLEGMSTLPRDEGRWSHIPAWLDLGQSCLSEVPVKTAVVNKSR